MSEKTTSKKYSTSTKILGGLFLVILIPYIIVVMVGHILWSLTLSITVWLAWGLHRRYVLFVYSDSLIWQAYIEKEILPRIKDRAVLLNWSEKKKWKNNSLAVLVFRHFGGYRNFNPMAVVLRPFRFVKAIRFYEAFKEFKHGDSDKVEKLKTELFKAAGIN